MSLPAGEPGVTPAIQQMSTPAPESWIGSFRETLHVGDESVFQKLEQVETVLLTDNSGWKLVSGHSFRFSRDVVTFDEDLGNLVVPRVFPLSAVLGLGLWPR